MSQYGEMNSIIWWNPMDSPADASYISVPKLRELGISNLVEVPRLAELIVECGKMGKSSEHPTILITTLDCLGIVETSY